VFSRRRRLYSSGGCGEFIACWPGAQIRSHLHHLTHFTVPDELERISVLGCDVVVVLHRGQHFVVQSGTKIAQNIVQILDRFPNEKSSNVEMFCNVRSTPVDGNRARHKAVEKLFSKVSFHTRVLYYNLEHVIFATVVLAVKVDVFASIHVHEFSKCSNDLMPQPMPLSHSLGAGSDIDELGLVVQAALRVENHRSTKRTKFEPLGLQSNEGIIKCVEDIEQESV